MKRLLAIGLLALAAFVFIASLLPSRKHSAFPADAFGGLPVLEGGRYKPMDSLARTSLLLLRGKQSAETPGGQRITASEWLMHLTLHPEDASEYPVFRIDHADLKESIGVTDFNRKYFSYREIIPHVAKFEERMQHIPQESALQDASQRDLVKLYNNLVLYRRLVYALRVPLMQDTVEGEYHRFMWTMIQAADRLQQNPEGDPEDPILKRLNGYFRHFGSLSDSKAPKFALPESGEGYWLNLSEALLATFQNGKLSECLMLYAQLSDAYIQGEVGRFEEVIGAIHERYRSTEDPVILRNIRAEALLNRLQVFNTSMTLYVLVLLGVLAGWLFLDERTLRAAFWILLAALLLHSLGMVARMILQGRPPVTNLYSSAVFVGWGSVVLGALLERFFKNGLGAAVAAMSGFLSLIVANHLMSSGDTMEMMRAVLDSNFWLATHVVTISLGYSSTYLAGFLGIAYVLMGLTTKRMDRNLEQSLVRMVYGVTCFSLLFSFVGTVLGGIWADQSWGRFWGWDPKENGALMIVLWTALMLHAKRGAVVKNIGFMNLAIFGNVITSWSWFGTNMLGVGLHSYGFMSAAFFWLILFCGSQAAIIALASWVPRSRWRSFASEPASAMQ
jgi:ABC-type transport system involved in cytochrome c biogenesis permease subunit